MKKLLLFLFSFLSFSIVHAQYTTPGTGVNWNMDSLVLYSDGVVWTNFFGDYLIGEDIILSESDSIFFDGLNIQIDFEVSIYVYGYFVADHPDGNTISDFSNSSGNYGRFRFEESSEVILNKVTFINGGGLKVISSNFDMDSCIVQNMNTTFNTGGAIELSNGNPSITNSSFLLNESAAISSAANAEVAPIIENNTFNNNNTSNTNRPQINLGPSGALDTTMIIGNYINGNPDNEQAGGIAFSSLLGIDGNVIIAENEVLNNRYGIAIIGNGINAQVKNNICGDNTTQNDPLLGGSGINFNASSTSTASVSGNEIYGNLWGITVQGEFEINLGDDSEESPGFNIFTDNGNGGEIYALYNNTPNPISALNNCWDGEENITLEDAEEVIFHEVDDPTLGLVSFDPMWNCGAGIGITEVNEASFSIYPNPVVDALVIESEQNWNEYRIYSIAGQEILAGNLKVDSPTRLFLSQLDPGIYVLELRDGSSFSRRKFVKV